MGRSRNESVRNDDVGEGRYAQGGTARETPHGKDSCNTDGAGAAELVDGTFVARENEGVGMDAQLVTLDGRERRGRGSPRPCERGRKPREDCPQAVQPRQHSHNMSTVYIGIGANLGEREATIREALALLAAQPGIEVEAVSSVRETDPVGVVDQPRFLNAAARLVTDLSPRAVLDRLLGVEQRLGRVRTGDRFGPRTIDLDLLVHGEEVVDEAGLRVPHPRLAERRFVLEPLAELDPQLEVPGLGRVETLLAELE